jgi:two-component system sensor histidine kinase/response regulator
VLAGVGLFICVYFFASLLQEPKEPIIFIAMAVFVLCGAASLASVVLVIRQRQELGLQTIFYALHFLILANALLFQGRTLTATLSLAAVSAISISWLFPRQAWRRYAARTATIILLAWIIEWLNPLWRVQIRVAQIGPAGAVVFGVVFAIVVAIQAWGISLRAKFLTSIIGITVVSIAIFGYFAYSRTQQLQSFLAAQLQTTVQTQAEQQLTSTTHSQAQDVDQALSSIVQAVKELADYRSALYAQGSVLNEGSYWDGRTKMSKLPAGQYINPPSDTAAVFIPNVVPVLDDALISDLNATVNLDFSAPGILKTHPNIVGLYYMSAYKYVAYYPNFDQAVVPPDLDATTLSWYTDVAPQNDPDRKAMWSQPYQDPAGTGLIVTLSSPVYDRAGTFQGVMAADVQLSKLTENVASISVGQSGFAFLIDYAGRIIAMPKPGYTLFGLQPEVVPVSETPKTNLIEQGPAEFQDSFSHMVLGQEGLSTVSIAGVDYYVVYTPLPTVGYSLGAIVPTAEMNAALLAARSNIDSETQRTLNFAAIILVALLLAAVGFSFLLSQYIARPLIELTNVADQISSGNFGVQARVESKDETGILARTLNAMGTALHELITTLEQRVNDRTRDLNIASDVSRQVTRVLDLNVLLPQLVERTKEGFHLYYASVYIYDPQAEELLLAAGTGEEGRRLKEEAKSFHMSARPSLVAQASRERRAQIINDTEKSTDYFNNLHLPYTRAEADFPMVVGDELVGVLDLQSESIGRFQPSDIQIFTSLAEQIAIAVRNAQLYHEQEQVAEQLRQVDQMKMQFLSSMSHELRTPLNAIINFTEMVAVGMMGPVNEDQQDLLNQSLEGSKHLLHLINDVLDISKIQAGKLTLFVEPDVNLYQELESVIGMVQPLLKSKPLQLVKDIDQDLPTITGDKRRIRQVLLNLLSNAIKFTPAGTITLSVKQQDHQVLFAVIDTGPGISAEAQAAIFEPFVQTPDGLKQAEGTGLGLPISRSLVQAHNGTLWVESQPGDGAAFYFSLPIVPAAKQGE